MKTKNGEPLKEVFNKAVEFKFRGKDGRTVEYEFYLGEQEIRVIFKKKTGIDIVFKSNVNDSNFYMVDFEVDKTMEKKDNSYNERSFQLFATLLEVIDDFIARYNPTGLGAFANGKQKNKLYKAIFKRHLKAKFEEYNEKAQTVIVYYKT